MPQTVSVLMKSRSRVTLLHCKGLVKRWFVSSAGRLAQLEERLPYKEEVTGSSPVPPTIFFFFIYSRLKYLHYRI